jgi:hypothetical protein
MVVPKRSIQPTKYLVIMAPAEKKLTPSFQKDFESATTTMTGWVKAYIFSKMHPTEQCNGQPNSILNIPPSFVPSFNLTIASIYSMSSGFRH